MSCYILASSLNTKHLSVQCSAYCHRSCTTTPMTLVPCHWSSAGLVEISEKRRVWDGAPEQLFSSSCPAEKLLRVLFNSSRWFQDDLVRVRQCFFSSSFFYFFFIDCQRAQSSFPFLQAWAFTILLKWGFSLRAMLALNILTRFLISIKSSWNKDNDKQ